MQPETETSTAVEQESHPKAQSLAQTLTAYLDGELSEPLREIMDARIAADPALRALVEELEIGRRLGLDLFKALARGPVPPPLARFTRSAR
ncbi:MAG TPA: hypothetical protein VN112_12120 [Ensifer sp.]|nr:hypothetical protein [Ensifer sp.]